MPTTACSVCVCAHSPDKSPSWFRCDSFPILLSSIPVLLLRLTCPACGGSFCFGIVYCITHSLFAVKVRLPVTVEPPMVPWSSHTVGLFSRSLRPHPSHPSLVSSRRLCSLHRTVAAAAAADAVAAWTSVTALTSLSLVCFIAKVTAVVVVVSLCRGKQSRLPDEVRYLLFPSSFLASSFSLPLSLSLPTPSVHSYTVVHCITGGGSVVVMHCLLHIHKCEATFASAYSAFKCRVHQLMDAPV